MPVPLDRSARAVLADTASTTRERGRDLIRTDVVLLALTAAPVAPLLAGHGVTPESVAGAIAASWPDDPSDDALLARLGIDADRVRAAAGVALRDPEAWRVRRSPVRPLRVVLHGPGAALPCSGQTRKALEVAHWYARRRRRPASDADLLRGVLCDRASRSRIVLARLGVPARTLWGELLERDCGTAA